MIVAAHCAERSTHSADVGIVVLDDSGEILLQTAVALTTAPTGAGFDVRNTVIGSSILLSIAALEGERIYAWQRSNVQWLVDAGNRTGRFCPDVTTIQRSNWPGPLDACFDLGIREKAFQGGANAVTTARMVAKIAHKLSQEGSRG